MSDTNKEKRAEDFREQFKALLAPSTKAAIEAVVEMLCEPGSIVRVTAKPGLLADTVHDIVGLISQLVGPNEDSYWTAEGPHKEPAVEIANGSMVFFVVEK